MIRRPLSIGVILMLACLRPGLCFIQLPLNDRLLSRCSRKTQSSSSSSHSEWQLWAASVKRPGEQGKEKAEPKSKPSSRLQEKQGGGGKRPPIAAKTVVDGAIGSKKRPAGGGAAAASKAKKGPILHDELAWSLSAKKALPDLTTLLPPLSDAQLLSFERDGHTVTRGLCTAHEVGDYTKVVRAAFEKEKLEAYRQKVRVLMGKAEYDACRTLDDCEELLDEVDPEMIPFLQTFNSWRKYQDLRKLALAPRFAHVAAQLLGVPRVRLYQDSTFFKRDGDGPTLWHSDLNMVPFNCNEFVTMWMPMTEIPPEEEGGTGLTFASKSHRDFALNYWDDPHAGEDLSERYEVASYGRLKPGDATWHHGWVLHSSPGNESGEDRIAYTLCFVADGVPLLGKDAKHSPDDEDDLSYADWIKDFKPGSRLSDHPYLPLVYDAATPSRRGGAR